MDHRRFIECLLIGIAIVALALLLWRVSHVLILAFAAILVGVIFASLAGTLHRRLSVPERIALPVAVLLVLAIIVGAGTLFGAQVAGQAQQMGEMLPRAWQAVQDHAASWGLGPQLEGALSQLGGQEAVTQRIGSIAMAVGAGVTDAVLVIVGGIYFAAQPGLYRKGMIKLAPEHARGLVADAIDDTGRALRLWLGGQLVSMLIIGVLTTLGLWLLGVPSALALGLLAGLLEFIPYVGPIIAAAPAVLIALTQSPELALWTVGLYLLLQQIEGNIVYPLVQQRAVDLPPALLLFTLLAGATLFGAAGIVVAAPLTVVMFVLVKRLYVREALNTKTQIPGEEKG